MKRNHTAADLWAFVNRANTLDEIKTAIAFLETANIKVLDNLDLYDELMNTLCYKLREEYRA